MWKIVFAKNELNHISDLIVSSGSLVTRSWRTVWFATLKPGQAFHDHAEQGKVMSYDFWDESQKKHTTQAWLILFFTLGTLPAPWGCTVMFRENTTEKPRWKAATIIESMRAHESLVDLSSQITNFLLKSWTLSSSDKTFLVPSLGILTLRICEHKKPLFSTTEFGDHLLCNHPTWNNNDIYKYFI